MTSLREKIPLGMWQFTAQCSSIPCINYLGNSGISVLEKIFWFLSMLTMFTISFVLVHQNVVQWQTNPTSINTDPTYYPVQSVQFPTVTICPDFNPDRFGFVRDLFNAFKYQCDSVENCNFAGGIRDYVPLTNITNHISLIDAVAKDTYNWLGQKIDKHYALVPPKIPFTSIDQYRHDDWVEWINIQITFLLNMYDYLARTNNDTNGDLKQHIMDKLTGRTNNYAIYDFLQYDNSLVPIPPPNSQNISELLYKKAMLTMAALNMPLPGGFGSMLTNFGFWQNSSVWSPYINPHWPVFDDNGDWWNTLDPTNKGEFDDISQFFVDIVATLFDVQNTDIAIYDIAPLLNPVQSYHIYDPPYQYQFGHTFWNWILRTNATQAYEIQYQHGGRYMDPAFPNNTFGKELGPHLNIVMEVMYHNMLRTRALTRDRFTRYSDIYEKLFEFLPFPVYAESEPFYPSWDDYRGDTHGVQYMAFQFETFYQGLITLPQRTSYKGANLLNDTYATLEMRNRYQQQNMMTLCNGPGANNQCEDQFHPVLTDSGICYAFNAMSHTTSFINNTYTQTFAHIFEPDNETDILNNGGSGKSFSMFLVLDNFQSKIPGAKQGTFKVSLNQMYDFVNVLDQEIEIDAGTHTKISVTVNQYTTTPAFQSLSLDTRQCRYTTENPNPESLFQFYSQKTCIFECKLQYSSKTSNCTPWNYPQYGNDKITEICDGLNSYNFENMMDDTINCSYCLPDCEEVEFLVKETILVIDYVKECQEAAILNDVNMNRIVGEKLRHMEGEEYLFWYNLIQDPSLDLGPLDYYNQNVFMYVKPYILINKCQELLQNDLAFLTIEIGDPQVTRLERDVAISFYNKLSDLGGTIGLFTGISLLSAIEISYWLIRLGMLYFWPNSNAIGLRNQTKA